MAEGGETDKTQVQLEEAIREQIENLDLEKLQAYVDSLSGEVGESVGNRLIEYIKGADFDYGTFGKEFLLVLFSKVAELIPAFACIMAIALLSGLLTSLKSGVTNLSSGEIPFLVLYLGSLIPLLSILITSLSKTWAGIQEMNKQMQLIFPLMLTLMAVSGGTVSAAVCKPAVAFFSTVIASILYEVVFPLTIVIIVFSIATNFTKELKIDRFAVFFKGINKWIIGVSVSVFGLFFTLQGVTAATYDGVVRRAAKYAIGNGVPIIGGFLSGGFDLVVAGTVLLKNALGSFAVFLMVVVIFEPLILLISVNVLLRLSSAVTQSLGDGRISKILGDTADNLHYCTACLLMTAFLYFLCIMLMIFCTEALF
ncbi:MAG: stage III sporulation protein AE [Clostridia bacterium]|nr:stage III sporulation protein AE [Clostridia bacterium]